MRNAHSPAPWNGSAAEIRDANGNVIAETFAVEDNPDKRYGYGTADANSRLISAAPDLLAALNGLYHAANQYTETLDCWLCGSLAGEPHEDECSVAVAARVLARVNGAA